MVNETQSSNGFQTCLYLFCADQKRKALTDVMHIQIKFECNSCARILKNEPLQYVHIVYKYNYSI